MRYEIGQRWYCDRIETTGRPNFYFVIIGKGSKPGYKRCRIDYEKKECPPYYSPLQWEQDQNLVLEYSHAHLKKYAVLVEE